MNLTLNPKVMNLEVERAAWSKKTRVVEEELYIVKQEAEAKIQRLEAEKGNWQLRMSRLERDGRELLTATSAAVDAGEEADMAKNRLEEENLTLKEALEV